MRAVERCRKFGLNLAAADHRLQLGAGLGVIFHHHGCKGFLGGISLAFRQRVGLDLEHVADRDLLDEIRGARADTENGIDSRLFADGLRVNGWGEGGGHEQQARSNKGAAFHDFSNVWTRASDVEHNRINRVVFRPNESWGQRRRSGLSGPPRSQPCRKGPRVGSIIAFGSGTNRTQPEPG